MRYPLPTAIAAALAKARAQHAADGAPAIPFIPETRADKRQLEAFGALDASQLDWKTWEAQLLGHAGAVLPYLRATHDELRDEAQRIPRQLDELVRQQLREQCRLLDKVRGIESSLEPDSEAEADVEAAEPEGYAAAMVAAAELRFGELVPGQTLNAQLARVRDRRYWSRFLARRVREAREHLNLKLGLVGAGGRQYCSEEARAQRRTQLQNQQQWLQDTMLRAVIDGKMVEIPLEQVAKSARQKLARLYAFIKAMDLLAEEAGLTVALLTTTLEGEWHANPQHRSKDHRWNGATPREANRELGERFQSIRRDLDKQGIRLSGLWAGEPHADGCPHRHHWVLFDPKHCRAVFAAFLGYFPGKLKLRGDPHAGDDTLIETREDALAGKSRKLRRKKEGAQVDVSIIDKKKGSSGASYVLKYVMKAVLAEADYADLVKPVAADGAAPAQKGKPVNAKDARKQLRALQSIDAHRSVWRMRSFQFFGINNCLSLWDELRRIQEPPQEQRLRELWRLARGGDTLGSLAGEQQRGDALGFLRALGGLAAAAGPEQLELGVDASHRARIYTVETETRYGEISQRVEGVELVPAGGLGKAKAVPLERVVTRPVRWQFVPKVSAHDGTKEGKVNAAVPGEDSTPHASRRPAADGDT
jgi:hypothetical protein